MDSKLPNRIASVPLLSPRDEATHKGEVGRVAIIAGSRGMNGAACLAGLGALRGGAGLVRVLTPESVWPIVAASDPCLMTLALPETSSGRIAGTASFAIIEESLGWADVVALGPGLGQDDDLPEFVATVLSKFGGPLVLDADGLNNAAKEGDRIWKVRAEKATIVTPHPGEITRLREAIGLAPSNEQDHETRLRTAHEFACAAGVTVVLKGCRTVVCTADSAHVNTTGNPGMASGGMGDVLTGAIAALLGQGLSAFDAARLGVHAHGLAADLCAQHIAPVGYLAHEVAGMLPQALAQASLARIGFK